MESDLVKLLLFSVGILVFIVIFLFFMSWLYNRLQRSKPVKTLVEEEEEYIDPIVTEYQKNKRWDDYKKMRRERARALGNKVRSLRLVNVLGVDDHHNPNYMNGFI